MGGYWGMDGMGMVAYLCYYRWLGYVTYTHPTGSGWRSSSFVCVVVKDTWDGYILFVINYSFSTLLSLCDQVI